VGLFAAMNLVFIAAFLVLELVAKTWETYNKETLEPHRSLSHVLRKLIEQSIDSRQNGR
jgi:hypothetical protein